MYHYEGRPSTRPPPLQLTAHQLLPLPQWITDGLYGSFNCMLYDGQNPEYLVRVGEADRCCRGAAGKPQGEGMSFVMRLPLVLVLAQVLCGLLSCT